MRPRTGAKAKQERHRWGRSQGRALWALLVASLMVLASCTADDPVPGAAGSGSGGQGGSAGQVVAVSTIEIDVELGDLYVEPASIEVEPGTAVTMNVVNVGLMPHDLKVEGVNGTSMLDPGQSETVTVGPFTETTEAWCTVVGHRESGMFMDIIVTGAPADAGHGGDHITTAAAAGGDFATINFNAVPDDSWTPYDPNLQPAPGGTEHEITLIADEVIMEVAPGVTQEMWVFNDMFPGPILRGKVGDIFTVTLINEGKIGHSLDFHSSKVAWNVEMRTIAPGESLVYQFEAKHAGAWMYHCGTAPAIHHIGNGMFGAMIIDPPDLPEVAREFIFVQSELYTGPMDAPGDLTKMINDQWDAVVFNGYVNQYQHAPIRVEANERIRAWVVNAGPSENSSFHIVGTIFDTVYKEGVLLLQPDETHGGSQALDLQPAQGGYVEFTFDVEGLYIMVTHKFSNASKGALGVFQAGDVEGDVAH